MKGASKMLLAGRIACFLWWPHCGRAQSAIWAGGTGDWFGGSANWVCVSGLVLSPCEPPDGTGSAATIGSLINGSPFTGSVVANAPVNLGTLAVGTDANGGLNLSTSATGSTSNQTLIGSQGMLTVNGGATFGSSTLTNNGSLSVTGLGSNVTSDYAHVGGISGAMATAVISGSGSQWVVNETLGVGTGGGNGTLTISSGSEVGPGILSTGLSTLVGSGAGSVGTVLVNSGNFNTQGLTVGGAGGTGSMTVSNGGSVSATGFVVVANHGTLALESGAFAGPLGFTLDSGGTLAFGIGSASGYPFLNVSNAIGILNGTIDFDFTNGFAPAAGETFNLIFSDGATDNFSGATYEVSGLASGFQYALLNEPQGLELEALNNGVSLTGAPEPRSVCMAAAG
jgi:T5SS/PEP-CTERM-associated repeat protein